MIDKSLILIWIIWYICSYGPPPLILNMILRFYYLYSDFFIFYNKLIYPGYWDEDENKSIETNINEETQNLPPKYEDKYLNDIRKISNEWVFTNEETLKIPGLFENFLNELIQFRVNKIEEINNEIDSLKKEIEEDDEDITYAEEYDVYGEEIICKYTLEERNEKRNEKISQLQEELQTLQNEINQNIGLYKLKTSAYQQASEYIINEKIDKLANSYVIEKTPIGNVLMIYKRDSESFQYYSDSSVPYRYLEVVARKYVKMFNCRPLYIDMEEELKIFEEKWEKENAIKKLKEEEQKKLEESIKNKENLVQTKKNVFAKFKNYNKDAGGKINMAAPPKNSIPNKTINEKEDAKVLLKEKANRYTYEGKLANFNFLQKIERKVFNKKLGLSFAEFKKMQQK